MKKEARTIAVTGAARGIGKAICASFIAQGDTVFATDVLTDELEQTAQELGENLIPVQHDVTSERQWQSLESNIMETTGRLDVLINNAGILIFSLLEEMSVEKFNRLFEVNVTGTFLGMKTFVPHMKSNKAGCIVNMSSSSAILPNNGTGAYSASKFAVRGLTRAAALELGPFGVRVNSVHPGGVNTPMTNPTGVEGDDLNKRFSFVPLQRGCEPVEVANLVRFLSSEEATYINGAELVVDGGLNAGQYFYGIPGAPR